MGRDDERATRKSDPGQSHDSRRLRERLSGQAEGAIGRLAEDLVENPVINSALQSAFGAAERVAQMQEQAMEALNLPSAASLDKLARRLRSVSQRLEEVEDIVEKLDRRLRLASGQGDESAGDLVERLDRVDARLDELGNEVGALRRDLTRREDMSGGSARGASAGTV